MLSTISMLGKLLLAGLYPVVGLLVDWSLSYALIILGLAAVIFSFVSRVKEEHLLD